MPPGIPTRKTFQYQDPNQITPQVLQANPGAFPAQMGQTLYSPFAPLNPGRNIQQQGFGNPFAPLNAGRNVQGGGNMNANTTPGRNVIGGVVTPPVVQPAPPSLNQPSPYAQQGQYLGNGVYLPPAGVPTLGASAGHPDPGLIRRLAQNPAEFNSLPPATQDAVERLLTQSQGGGPQPKGSPTWTKEGYAPNGVNAQGQRLDSTGNVWDPKTAQVDIYGDPFVMKGQSSGRRTAKYGGGAYTPEKPTGAIKRYSLGVVNFNVSSG